VFVANTTIFMLVCLGWLAFVWQLFVCRVQTFKVSRASSSESVFVTINEQMFVVSFSSSCDSLIADLVLHGCMMLVVMHL